MQTTFYLKKEPNSKSGIIYFLFTSSSSKIRITTGIKIKINLWQRGFPKVNRETNQIREMLSQYKAHLDHFINSYHLRHRKTITSVILKKECNIICKGDVEEEGNVLIKTLIDRMILEQSKEGGEFQLKKSTIKYKKTHLTHFVECIGQNKRLCDLNLDILNKYRTHLHADKNQNDTKNSHLKSVLTFLNWLFKKDIIKKKLHINKFTKVDKPIITLTQSEVETLENANLPTHIQNQVDIFLIAIHTTLSISDLKRVNRDVIIDDFIHTHRVKTDNQMIIPLNDKCKRILEKHNYKLPHIHENKSPLVLKKAFEILNLNRKVMVTKKYGNESAIVEYVPLSSIAGWRLARKTGITQLFQQKEISMVSKMKITGHKDYRSMKRYINADQIIIEEQSLLNN